ncbi:BadF/BadG/BcrA/BcrD ATPase family protein [Wukongibacter baidiensis]|uniref:N-acetylglucosamine kinase n=1 Tax=Wukongibacter baidiensis TaxID=1723361 RepID=UPI003D7FCEE7
MIFLGVDGGGTKTAFMLINEEGRILGYTVKGTCHYKQVGIDGFSRILKEGIEEGCNKAGINIDDISFSFLGLPGYGEIVEDARNMEKEVKTALMSDRFRCGNDVEAGWAGSLACRPGINIVAGTGAIGVGINRNGKIARASGWGHICGDEGSAYWLGKKAIEIFGKESDGRLEKTPIYEIMRRELNIERDFDLISIVLDKYKVDRGKIAGLAEFVFKAAQEGDKYAIEVFEEAAYEHCLTIGSIIKQLDFSEEDELLVSYSGGVFKAGELVLDPLERYISGLHKNIRIVKPVLKPITGSALYALKLGVEEFDEEIIVRLIDDERSKVQ